MKRLIFMLLTVFMSMTIAAQDVIVKKDGSTILSKVVEISDTQVKYKKYSNVDGPTYVVNVSELTSINYQNGEKESFDAGIPTTDSQAETYTPTATASTKMSGNMSDMELIRAYKQSNSNARKIRKLKIWGWIGTGMVATGAIMFGYGVGDFKYYEYGLGVTGLVLLATGFAIAPPCLVNAYHKQKTYNRLQSASLFQQEIPLTSRTRLTADVNLLKDNFSKQQTVGIGFHLNF